MSRFERYLSLWVALAMVAGLILGNIAPGLVTFIAGAEIASVNLVVAVLIWAMVYPMMVGVDLSSIRGVASAPRGLAITLVVNWLIKPFSMAFLAVLFFETLFAPWIAPIVAFLLGVTDITVPWETLLLSVVLYIVLPLIAGMITRARLGATAAIDAFKARVSPFSAMALTVTVVILFALQAETIVSRPTVIGLIAVPIVIQSYSIFAVAYAGAWAAKVPHRIAAPCAMIGTSNFFELAIAVAISLFGLGSGAALATVVGVLVEVPVMLSLVGFANRTRERFPA